MAHYTHSKSILHLNLHHVILNSKSYLQPESSVCHHGRQQFLVRTTEGAKLIASDKFDS